MKARDQLIAMLRGTAIGYDEDSAGFVRTGDESGARFAASMRDTLRGMAEQPERDGTLLGDDGEGTP